MVGQSPWRGDYSTSGFTYVEMDKICRVTQEEILSSLGQQKHRKWTCLTGLGGMN